MNHLIRYIQISLVERLTDIIGKVKKEIIHKTNQPATFKTSLSTQVEALMKGSCGECWFLSSWRFFWFLCAWRWQVPRIEDIIRFLLRWWRSCFLYLTCDKFYHCYFTTRVLPYMHTVCAWLILLPMGISWSFRILKICSLQGIVASVLITVIQCLVRKSA